MLIQPYISDVAFIAVHTICLENSLLQLYVNRPWTMAARWGKAKHSLLFIMFKMKNLIQTWPTKKCSFNTICLENTLTQIHVCLEHNGGTSSTTEYSITNTDLEGLDRLGSPIQSILLLEGAQGVCVHCCSSSMTIMKLVWMNCHDVFSRGETYCSGRYICSHSHIGTGMPFD